jgi:MFS transporter, PAT family, beta-lactamase induction signal transducer AmpG
LIAVLAVLDLASESSHSMLLFLLLVLIGAGIGIFTAASYAMYMNLSQRSTAATQFSTFMGAINGCESWSVYVLGRLIARWGYGPGFLTMCVLSLLALPMLRHMSHLGEEDAAEL